MKYTKILMIISKMILNYFTITCHHLLFLKYKYKYISNIENKLFANINF